MPYDGYERSAEDLETMRRWSRGEFRTPKLPPARRPPSRAELPPPASSTPAKPALMKVDPPEDVIREHQERQRRQLNALAPRLARAAEVAKPEPSPAEPIPAPKRRARRKKGASIPSA